MYKAVNTNPKRNGYEKLNKSGRRKRSWRFKIKPKLKFFKTIFSPKRFFVKLRDAYVNMMIGFANSAVSGTGFGLYGGTGFGETHGFGIRPVKEYDEKMLVEMYKSIVMAQGVVVSRDAGKLCSKIISK